MQSPGGGPPRSGLLTAWGNAWLSGEAALSELVARVAAADDRHTVTGLADAELALEQAMGRLRAGGITRLRLVLPAPGDLVGLPGPGAFTAAALAASEAVLALRPDGVGTGLVPAVTVHGSALDGTVTTVAWSAHPVTMTGPDPGPFLPDAEYELRRGLVECVDLLRDLDVARWRPEVAGALQQLRSEARRGVGDAELPRSYSPRSRDLLSSARQLAGVLHLAADDAGGAIDAAQARDREQALGRLRQLVRRARVAAYNSAVHPSAPHPSAPHPS